MHLKATHWKSLPNRDDRLIARIAAKARCDTIWGGCKAMFLAKKLNSFKHGSDLRWVVSQVYAESTGSHNLALEAWECPECGQAYLGQERAWECCTVQEYE